MKLKHVAVFLISLSMLISIFAGCQPNSQPLADYQSLKTTRDTIANITLTGSDMDSDPLNFEITTAPSNGTLQVPSDFSSSGNLAYIPNPGYIGSDSFTFVVNDGIVDSDSATVSIAIILGTFTDDAGRQVDISEVPERIVSFGPNITEILFALGLEENVVGVDDYSDYPEAAKLKPKVGNAFSPSIEAVVGLEPDLVLTVKQEQFNSELDSLGIKYIVLDPKDVDSIVDSIELAAEVTGRVKEGSQLVKDMRDRMSQVVDLVKGAPKVRVFFIIDAAYDPNNPYTAGAGSFIDTLITMAGGENIAAEAPGGWVQLSLEQIVDSNPDIIIIQTMIAGEPTITKEELEVHPVWQQMTAVKQGKVYIIDGDLVSRAGPRIVQGLEEMAKKIHPELFE